MTTDELLPNTLRDLPQVVPAGLLGDARQEVHLKQEIAQLVGHMLMVFGPNRADRVDQLVGLLERVGDDVFLRLFPIPRTQLPERAGEVVQPAEGCEDGIPTLSGSHLVHAVLPTTTLGAVARPQ
jgi:hypothetical protein